MATAGASRSGSTDTPRREKRMSLGAHLLELRRRLMIGGIALVAGMIVAAIATTPIIELLTIPIDTVASSRGDSSQVQLMFTTVTSGFDLRVRISIAIGLLVSAPVWLWQVWAFVMPGLTRKEVRYTIWFVVAAVPLFFAGTAVGWLVMPHIIEVMATFVPEGDALMYQYDYYYDFILKLLLVVGISFVLPVFLVALNIAGVMSGRAILKGWRVAVLVATAFAAVATPAVEVVSMIMLAAILVVLYFAAAGVSLLFDRRRSKQAEQLLAAEPGA